MLTTEITLGELIVRLVPQRVYGLGSRGASESAEEEKMYEKGVSQAMMHLKGMLNLHNVDLEALRHKWVEELEENLRDDDEQHALWVKAQVYEKQASLAYQVPVDLLDKWKRALTTTFIFLRDDEIVDYLQCTKPMPGKEEALGYYMYISAAIKAVNELVVPAWEPTAMFTTIPQLLYSDDKEMFFQGMEPSFAVLLRKPNVKDVPLVKALCFDDSSRSPANCRYGDGEFRRMWATWWLRELGLRLEK